MRNNKHKIIDWVCLIAALTLFSGCLILPGDNTNLDDVVTIPNPKINAAMELVDVWEEDTLAPTLPKVSGLAKNKAPMIDTLMLVATIPALQVEGQLVQANDILIKGNTAYIAYNTAGDEFRGALQVVEITQEQTPEITHEFHFPKMDVSVLYTSESKIYIGGSADPDVYPKKSFIGFSDGSSPDAASLASSFKFFDSHGVTAITKKAELMVSIGAQDGEILKLSDQWGISASSDLGDIRDLKEYQNGFVTISGTTDNQETEGKLSIFKMDDFSDPVEVSLPDFGSNYHKATLEISQGHIALLGLSELGFKVMDIESPSNFIYELPNPAISSPLLSNTNSVTYDGKYIFTANGNFGFRVFEKTGTDFSNIKLLGFVDYSGFENEDGEFYSANHIEFRANHLFVASGVGGVRIYRLK